MSRLLDWRWWLILLLLAGVFAQSYYGRVDVIAAERAQCHASVGARVEIANGFRADEQANMMVAADPQQPLRTRRARAHEAMVERRVLLTLDRRIDPRDIGDLNRVGQGIVRRLGSRAFSCVRAYPPTTPWQFING